MKKFVPYLIGFLALILILLAGLYAPLKKSRKLDERLTLRRHDKIPYGTNVANRLLRATFLKAHISYDKAAPGFWEGIDADTSGQAVFLVGATFSPGEDELSQIARFIRQGNYVFVITQDIGAGAAAFFGLENEKIFFTNKASDSLEVSLRAPFAAGASYFYPGKRFDSYFSSLDSTTAVALGSNGDNHTNFIQLQSGAGRLFIHLAPLTFSNYFILHKNNIHYFQNILSLLPDDVHAIVWNEYYLTRHKPKEKEPDLLRVLWQYQPFRWGLITAVVTMLLYVLSAMRRRQRIIPLYAKPANDSLDFVRTIGRLYYERRDHYNLSKKMAAFFLEHVRNRYKIVNTTPDALFVNELHAKSNYGHEELKKILAFIQYMDTCTFITEQELARFYQQLNLFYKSTDGTIV